MSATFTILQYTKFIYQIEEVIPSMRLLSYLAVRIIKKIIFLHHIFHFHQVFHGFESSSFIQIFREVEGRHSMMESIFFYDLRLWKCEVLLEFFWYFQMTKSDN